MIKKRTICLRIKKIYLDQILSGAKKKEYRKYSDFYKVRFDKKPEQILFLSGKRKHYFEILSISVVESGGLGDVKQFMIELGKETV